MKSSRAPRHPGRILEEDFLSRLPPGWTQAEVADRLGVTRPRLNELIRRKRGVTPDTALRLARAFGTEPEFWLEAQMAWDLYEVARSRKLMKEVERVGPLLDGGASPSGVGEERSPAGSAPADRRAGIDLHVPTPARESRLAGHYEEFLSRRGLLGQARRFAKVRAELDELEAGGRLSTGAVKDLIFTAPPLSGDD